VLAKPKQIIIDKDAFIGLNIDDLCAFTQKHLVLLCDTLLYECATASKQEPGDLLERYRKLIKCGAYYCSCSVTYLQKEGNNLCPYPWFLPEFDPTEQIRTGKARLEDVLDSPKTGQVFQARCKVAKAVFVDLSATLKNRLDKENPDVGKKAKRLSPDRFERFRLFFESIDAGDMHQMCVESLPKDWIKNEAKFCLSPEWMSWQLIRLTDAIVQDYHYFHQMGGPQGDKTAEHDYQDMEYVLLLSRADALLTRDKKLVEPLAKAAFPDKDVFSSLDEVPEDHVCHWS